MSLDPKAARTLDRILALGYTEAARRASPVAKLDVLTEITAAACDLVVQEPTENDFYLARVEVFHESRTNGPCASTLAKFDSDLATKFEVFQKAIDRGWTLSLPIGSDVVLDQLQDFWNEAVAALGLEPPPEQPEAHPRRTSESAAQEFHASLRHAFDTIVEQDAGNAFTLRVHPQASYKVTEDHSANFALGYCLPSSRLLDVYERLAASSAPVLADVAGPRRLRLLETLLRPHGDEAHFRSQSHTNVTTRTAGLVRGQVARTTKNPYKPTSFAGPEPSGGPISPELVATLEEAAWGRAPPPSVFMMPLTNHDLSGADAPRTVAHWYLSVERCDDAGARAALIETLIVRRYHARLLFSESIYQRYCKALATALAIGILDGLAPPELSSHLESVAAAYVIPPSKSPKVFQAMEGNTSLFHRFDRLRECGAIRNSSKWQQEVDLRLRALCLDLPRLRPTHETDVVLRLVRELELEVGRRDAGVRLGRAELRRTLDDLRTAITMALAIETKVRGVVGYEEAPFSERIAPLATLFLGSEPECVDAQPVLPAFNGIQCMQVHDTRHLKEAQSCPLCMAEQERRIALLFGARARQGTDESTDTSIVYDEQSRRSRDAFLAFLSEHGIRPWDWLKRSCQAPDVGGPPAKTNPRLACLVSLLFACNARVKWTDALHAKWDEGIQGLPDKWTLGLSALANLSIDETPGGSTGTVSISEVSDEKIVFLVEVSYANDAEWKAKVAAAGSTTHGHSSLRHVAAAYLYTGDRLPALGTDGFLNDVSVVASDGRLTCTWRLRTA